MSKYVSIQHYLEKRPQDRVPMTFDEIEEVLGFRLPASAHRHRAWWSNNSSNSVMTDCWMKAGFKTSDVDMEKRKLVFRRSKPLPPAEPPVSGGTPRHIPVARKRPSLLGRLKGYISIQSGTDITKPAEPDWPEPDDQN
ncbi:DUF7662 domain-containing protein [Acuticoccus yangtzensis]|uniref:DUF7662 domain-containing protein n=1 Tax=Acuticoccus yangtzensis TaxID=1443441 RepID=UPI003CCC2277